MARVYFKPTGEVTNPETAYATIMRFVKEDLYLSVSNFFYCDRDHHLTNLLIWCQPLAVGLLEERPSREIDQYLTGILNVLAPREEGQKRGVRHMLERGKQMTHRENST